MVDVGLEEADDDDGDGSVFEVVVVVVPGCGISRAFVPSPSLLLVVLLDFIGKI